MTSAVTGGVKRLLIVPGAHDAAPVVAAARAMDLATLVVDAAPDAAAFAVADAGLVADPLDTRAVVDAVRAFAARTPIDGVLGVGVDVSATVAAVAHALRLPGPTPEIATLLDDRLALRTRLGALRVPVPWSAAVPCAAAVERVAAARDQRLVLRPVDAAGPAVILLPGVDPAWGFERAAAASPTGQVMAEEREGGPRVRLDGVVVGGRLAALAIADLCEPAAERVLPYALDGGATLPTALRPGLDEQVTDLVATAVAGLGMASGPITAEAAVAGGRVRLTTLTAGLSGGYACTHEVPLATGVHLVEAAIRLALGEPLAAGALRARWSRGVASRVLFPSAGTVVAVHGTSEAAAGDGVALLAVRVAPGDHVPRGGQGGVVVAVAERREVAVARAEAAAARIAIVTVPVLASLGATLH